MHDWVDFVLWRNKFSLTWTSVTVLPAGCSSSHLGITALVGLGRIVLGCYFLQCVLAPSPAFVNGHMAVHTMCCQQPFWVKFLTPFAVPVPLPYYPWTWASKVADTDLRSHIVAVEDPNLIVSNLHINSMLKSPIWKCFGGNQSMALPRTMPCPGRMKNITPTVSLIIFNKLQNKCLQHLKD